MTEQTNAELIAEAKSRAELCDADTREAVRDTGNIIVRLAAALEAANQRAAELAAVLMYVEDYVTRHYLDTEMGRRVIEALSIEPGDLLHEVKADVWDEGSQTGFTHGMSYQAGSNDAMYYRNPYRKEQS